MPYRIEKETDIHVVNIWGNTSKWEVIEAIGMLQQKDPTKSKPDLWILSDDLVLPYDAFSGIIEMINQPRPEGFIGNKTAVVASSKIQLFMAETFSLESGSLPYSIGVFSSRNEAVEWLNTAGN